MSKSQNRTQVSVRDDYAISCKLRDKHSFYTNGAMRGETRENNPVKFSDLLIPTIANGSHLPQYVVDTCKNYIIDYVVYDYNTPIAFHVIEDRGMKFDSWIVPNYKYSNTTTRHQGTLREALYRITTQRIRNWDENSFHTFSNQVHVKVVVR
jgi:hypothetical protein